MPSRSIRLELANDRLLAALRLELNGRTDLVETDGEDADVIVADGDPAEFAGAGRDRFLRIGAGVHGRNGLDSAEPSLILSAAAIVAAGYFVDHLDPAGNLNRPLGPIHLSHRERQVAALLVDGASNKAIARALDISVHTAKFHVTAVLDKLGARNRADAVSIVLREGLVAL